MNAYTFLLPWPARELSPNARIDRRKRAELVTWARESALYLARNTTLNSRVAKPDGDLELVMKFYPPNRKRRDLDNLLSSCKPALDGLFQAIEIDDSRVKRIVLDWGEPWPNCGQVEVWIQAKGE